MQSESMPVDGVPVRGAVVQRLLQRVQGLLSGFRQNVAILGHEGSGKSLLLNDLARGLNGRGPILLCLEIYPENFRTFTERFLSHLIIRGLAQKGGIPSQGSLKALLEQARHRLPETASCAQKVLGLLPRNPDAAFQLALDLPMLLAAETGAPLLVQLDEFDRLGNFHLRDPFASFGRKIQLQKSVMYLVTSSRPHRARLILKEKLNLLFGHFEVMELAGLDPDSARELMTAEAGAGPVPATEANFLIALTSGHPFYLKHIARTWGLVASTSLTTRPAPALDRGSLMEALEKELVEKDGCLHSLFRRHVDEMYAMRSHRCHISVLSSLAQGNRTCAHISHDLGLTRKEASKQLTRLHDMDLVLRSGQLYAVKDSLFAYWLKTVWCPTLVQGDACSHEVRRLFRTSLESDLDAFIRAGQQGIRERVAALFRKFENDLVEIGARKVRLPLFEEVCPRSTGLDGALPLTARRGSAYWVGHITNGHTSEAEITHFARELKKSRLPVKRKIIISQRPLDINARLVAKEAKIWTWDLDEINLLLNLYGQPKIIV
ncbi:MAG: ATP-binding protein [Candidatus Omnitrophica bacterium]|nr:ATP-binding protein [Candidatus Omnitrophota bacterium]